MPNKGSIPFTRSNRILVSRRVVLAGDMKKPALGGRFFFVRSLLGSALKTQYLQ
jgi:hypothetical protein